MIVFLTCRYQGKDFQVRANWYPCSKTPLAVTDRTNLHQPPPRFLINVPVFD
jgi:hypothetical protein